ncbi:MAG: DUF2273 domain-containing protein [Spirochaetes bacterium]|nr:DUF2273 domain-containing protein [Spirochaetota bacterium]
MRDLVNAIGRWMINNPNRCVFAAIGLVSSVLILTIGFWRFAFIFVITAALYIFGYRRDKGRGFRSFIRRFIFNKYR